MAENVLHKTSVKFADSMDRVAQAKGRLSEAFDDGIDAAARTVRKGREAAEDLVDDAVHTVKHKPLETVAVTFGVAFGLGAIVGWLVARKLR